MRLLRDRAVGHRAGLEAANDIVNALDLAERNGIFRVVKVEQAPEIHGFHFFVEHVSVFFEQLIISVSGRRL